MGADHLVNYKTTPEWSSAVREVSGGRGADFIMEVGGGGTFEESMKAVRIGGHIAVIGVLGGFVQQVNFAAVLGASVRIQGLSVGSREMFEAMNRALVLHQIHPVVDKVYPWTEARTAFAAMQAGEHFGKIVLEVG
jgi:NADPH:quinone reductase-like Zn-dependent oxidoreductase